MFDNTTLQKTTDLKSDTITLYGRELEVGSPTRQGIKQFFSLQEAIQIHLASTIRKKGLPRAVAVSISSAIGEHLTNLIADDDFSLFVFAMPDNQIGGWTYCTTHDVNECNQIAHECPLAHFFNARLLVSASMAELIATKDQASNGAAS